MEDEKEGEEIQLEVTKDDVSASWEVVKLSMFTYIQFKVWYDYKVYVKIMRLYLRLLWEMSKPLRLRV